MNLEELTLEIEKKGKIWVGAKQVAERLDDLKKTVLAKVQTDLELRSNGTKISESKLERLALASQEYQQHIIDMCAAKKNEREAFIEYEAYKNLFEATRSTMAMERARMNLI